MLVLLVEVFWFTYNLPHAAIKASVSLLWFYFKIYRQGASSITLGRYRYVAQIFFCGSILYIPYSGIFMKFVTPRCPIAHSRRHYNMTSFSSRVQRCCLLPFPLAFAQWTHGVQKCTHEMNGGVIMFFLVGFFFRTCASTAGLQGMPLATRLSSTRSPTHTRLVYHAPRLLCCPPLLRLVDCQSTHI